MSNVYVDGNIIFKDLSGNTINPKECKIGYLPQNFGMIKTIHCMNI